MPKKVVTMSADDDKLAAIRQKIDTIDSQIHSLLSQRAACAMDVAKIKLAAVENHAEAAVFYRPEREAQVLRAVIERNDGILPGAAVAHIFREIMSACLALEKPLNVGYLGPKGTFTQAAAFKQFGHAANAIPYSSVDRIFKAVESGECSYGVVPIENSTEGVVNHSLDCLSASPLSICGEVEIPIALHLLAGIDSSVSIPTKICAHQQALAQARQWLDKHYPNIERVAVASNGEAAQMAAAQPDIWAIAGDLAVSEYGLRKVASNIEDRASNTTRFFVISGQRVMPSGRDKTCLMVSARNEPGALFNLLKPFNEHHINMTRLVTRPSRTENWAYAFFMEFEGHQDDSLIAAIIEQLEANSYAIKRLGSFPSAVF